MKAIKLDASEIENIEDCIPLFEDAFQIKLENSETEKLQSFNEFSDLIISKFTLEHNEMCTTQKAFYQFRKAINEAGISKVNNIHPDSELKDIFPRRNRIKNIKSIEEKMELKFEILKPSQTMINILFFLLVLSIIGLFFIWKIALYGIFISFLGYYLTRFTKRLDRKTTRELIEKITVENYFHLRNYDNTINKTELKPLIVEWFSEYAGIRKEKLEFATFV